MIPGVRAPAPPAPGRGKLFRWTAARVGVMFLSPGNGLTVRGGPVTPPGTLEEVPP